MPDKKQLIRVAMRRDHQEVGMFAQRIQHLTSSIIREILAAAQQPGVISFAGGLPARAASPNRTGARADPSEAVWHE